MSEPIRHGKHWDDASKAVCGQPIEQATKFNDHVNCPECARVINHMFKNFRLTRGLGYVLTKY